MGGRQPRPDAWRLTRRLAELTGRYGVPGASVAVLAGDSVTAAATGVLSLRTGVEVTTDSLFQMGSISKAYTATVLMRLVERGVTDLDASVAGIPPRLATGAWATSALTLRHLLTHTSGLDGDFFEDTGRGDDCLARYVEACTGLATLHAPELTMFAPPERASSPIAVPTCCLRSGSQLAARAMVTGNGLISVCDQLQLVRGAAVRSSMSSAVLPCRTMTARVRLRRRRTTRRCSADALRSRCRHPE